jgi:membrane protease YdiL (CAAX protease family)
LPLHRTSPNRIIVFYVITLALAVVVRLAVPLVGEASLLLTMLTPAVATVVMLTVIAPEGGFRQALASLGLDRAGLKGWPLAIAAPAVIHGAGFFLLAVLGLAVIVAPATGMSPVFMIFKIITGLVIATVLAMFEEVGWRGYMLPRLKGLPVLSAMLVVGLLHGIWHLPLLLTTDYYHSAGNPWIVAPLFLVTLTLAGVFYGFLRLWTGSVWPVAIAHAAANTAWDFSSDLSAASSEAVEEYVGGESGVIMIGGLLILSLAIARSIKGRSFAVA